MERNKERARQRGGRGREGKRQGASDIDENKRRYYPICCQPLVYRNKMTPMRVALMIGGCWSIPTFISFLPIMQGWNSIGINHLIEERRHSEGSNSTSCVFMVNKPYALTCSVVAFYIPLILMVLAYQRIYVTARAHALQISMLQRAGANATVDSADHQRNHRMRTETKAAKTLCIIMGCFCLCWAPFFVTNVVDPFIGYTVPEQLWAACLWLGYINSMLNPILYAFLNKSFRRAFLIILCCGRKRYRRPSILGSAQCTTTQINGSTHVLNLRCGKTANRKISEKEKDARKREAGKVERGLYNQWLASQKSVHFSPGPPTSCIGLSLFPTGSVLVQSQRSDLHHAVHYLHSVKSEEAGGDVGFK
ncbi:hypothetical protein NQD34_007652 [Periophthalmus magnuspinnatus]|nr:hypothetical protein NQD34_007652 [Periophthalmus magnuspinnatus]